MPNAGMFVNRAGQSIVYTVREVAAGEELCICYVNELLLQPTSVRQHELWSSHEFRCRCARCVQRTAIDNTLRASKALHRPSAAVRSEQRWRLTKWTGERYRLDDAFRRIQESEHDTDVCPELQLFVEFWERHTRPTTSASTSAPAVHRACSELFETRSRIIEALERLIVLRASAAGSAADATFTNGVSYLSKDEHQLLVDALREQIQAMFDLGLSASVDVVLAALKQYAVYGGRVSTDELLAPVFAALQKVSFLEI
jgi:hypothetical protein